MSHNKNFDFIIKKPSLEEKINLEEEDLIETISLMNQYFKGDNDYKNEFAKYFNTPGLTENEEEKQFGSSSTTDTSLIEDLIKKNLNSKDSNLKLLLIGKRGVGKTKFKNILVNSFSQENPQIKSEEIIQPTLSYLYSKFNLILVWKLQKSTTQILLSKFLTPIKKFYVLH